MKGKIQVRKKIWDKKIYVFLHKNLMKYLQILLETKMYHKSIKNNNLENTHHKLKYR